MPKRSRSEQRNPVTKAPAIGLLHGYLLGGSGSNLWTQANVRAFCRAGATVHLMCQEPHPERFDFVAEAFDYGDSGERTIRFSRRARYPGRCVLHKPCLGGVLPVYVGDKYEEHERVIPMVDLDDPALEDYLRRNQEVLERIIAENHIDILLANHVVLMPVVAQRAAAARSIPFVIMSHGSAIEYAVKKDERFHRLAAEAIDGARGVLATGPEMRQRLLSVFADRPRLRDKLVGIKLGVDTNLFVPVPRASRPKTIEKLERTLRDSERGKQREVVDRMRAHLDDVTSPEDLGRFLAEAADYPAKRPDADCESKLSGVDWRRERVLIYVGRLIAGKGVHTLVAAMPSILAREPKARLVLVGHGPLREALEAMAWALETGRRRLFERIVAWGQSLEGTRHAESLIHIRRYLALLERRGELDAYYEIAREARLGERVIFTGYLTHRELRFLLPCCDVAVFPSIVAEAGPLVFLEALASGVFPMGIDIAGMAANIDALSGTLPGDVLELMKLPADPDRLVAEMASKVLAVFRLGRAHAAALRRAALRDHDSTAVGRALVETLRELTAPP